MPFKHVRELSKHLRRPPKLSSKIGTGGRQSKELLQASRDGHKGVKTNLDEQQKQCLQSLYKTDYEFNRLRNPERAPNTCQWFLRHEMYRAWRKSPESSLLWISADPGCGKSVLASFLVDEFRSCEFQANMPATVCHFFFKDDNDTQRRAHFAIATILHQLFSNHPELLAHAVSELQLKGNAFINEFHTIWNILLRALADSKCGNVIWVIDALDECEEGSRHELMKVLVKFFRNLNLASHSWLKIILTGRPYRELERGFQLLPSIRLRAEDDDTGRAEDVKRAVNHRVEMMAQSLGIRHADRINALKNSLITRANETFLWTSLVLDELDKSLEGSEEQIKQTINQIPPSLDAVYERILHRSPDRQRAKTILFIILAAPRPLTLQEMNVALAVGQDTATMVELERRMMPNVEASVKQICGFFVRVIKSRIFLVHQTAREFLCSEAGHAEHPYWKHSMSLPSCHHLLGQLCIDFLSIDELRHKSFNLYLDRPLDLPRILTEYSELVQRQSAMAHEQYPFLEYSSSHWVEHFNQGDISDNQHVRKARSLCRAPINYSTLWFLEHSLKHRHRDLLSPVFEGEKRSCADQISMLIAAKCGLVPIVQDILEGSDDDVSDEDVEDAQFIAVRNGHMRLVELLLHNGRNVNKPYRTVRWAGNIRRWIGYTRSWAGYTLLQVAAEARQSDIVKLLLKNGASVNALKHEQIISPDCLKDPRIDHNDRADLFDSDESEVNYYVPSSAPDHDEPLLRLGETALHLAIRSKDGASIDKGTIPALLDYGADAKQMSFDLWRGNALDTAASVDAVVDAELLLRHRSNPYSMKDISNALIHAASKSACHMIAFLLEQGADVNHCDYQGRTPLLSMLDPTWSSTALKIYEWDALRILLEAGAEIAESTLFAAIENDNLPTLAVLLHYSLSRQGSLDGLEPPDQKQNRLIGDEMLRKAFEYRQLSVAKFLFEHGANVSSDIVQDVMQESDKEAVRRWPLPDGKSKMFGEAIRAAYPDYRAERLAMRLRIKDDLHKSGEWADPSSTMQSMVRRCLYELNRRYEDFD